MHTSLHGVAILCIYVADLSFARRNCLRSAKRSSDPASQWGPGGKNSNQVVAAMRASADVSCIGMLGRESFADQAWHVGARRRHRARAIGRWPGHWSVVHYLDRPLATMPSLPALPAWSGEGRMSRRLPPPFKARVFATQLKQPAAAAMRDWQIARQVRLVQALTD